MSASAWPTLHDVIVSERTRHAVGGSKRTMWLCRARNKPVLAPPSLTEADREFKYRLSIGSEAEIGGL